MIVYQIITTVKYHFIYLSYRKMEDSGRSYEVEPVMAAGTPVKEAEAGGRQSSTAGAPAGRLPFGRAVPAFIVRLTLQYAAAHHKFQ
jgi:hypothetical protein